MLGCEVRLLHGRDLLHDEAAGIVHASDEVARVVERERDDRGRVLERRIESICVEIRYDVIHCERTFRQIAELGELAAELVRRTVPCTKAPERAGVGNRRRQRWRREDAHPRLDEGNLDAYEVTQWGTHPTTSILQTGPGEGSTSRRSPVAMDPVLLRT